MAATSSHIFLTVTNDLSYDQRMQRIAGSLAAAGYQVTLVGRELPSSLPLQNQLYRQFRIRCRNKAGKLFYLEYNWRLYRFLQQKINETRKNANAQIAICAIDLDTILPCHRIARKFDLPAVYDAHELFTELTEVKRRPMIHALWLKVERALVPQFFHGYTVNQFIADEFNRRYGVKYEVIRNMPLMKNGGKNIPNHHFNFPVPEKPFFLYQGAVNEGRSFETLIPAMKMVKARLLIAGDGNFFQQAKALTKEHNLEDKVTFTGYISPNDLKLLTPIAFAGITIFENTGLNQYHSLANRYFDYIQAGIPQLCVQYPEYVALNEQFETALLTENISSAALAQKMNLLLVDNVMYEKLASNCVKAGKILCWEQEEKRLLALWESIIPLNKASHE